MQGLAGSSVWRCGRVVALVVVLGVMQGSQATLSRWTRQAAVHCQAGDEACQQCSSSCSAVEVSRLPECCEAYNACCDYYFQACKKCSSFITKDRYFPEYCCASFTDCCDLVTTFTTAIRPPEPVKSAKQPEQKVPIVAAPRPTLFPGSLDQNVGIPLFHVSQPNIFHAPALAPAPALFPQPVPTFPETQAAPTFLQPQAAPAFSQAQAAPTFLQPQAIHTFQKPQAVPTFQKPQAIPTLQKPQAVPTLQKSQAVPTLQKPQAVPRFQKPQAVPAFPKPRPQAAPSLPRPQPALPKPPFTLSQRRVLGGGSPPVESTPQPPRRVSGRPGSRQTQQASRVPTRTHQPRRPPQASPGDRRGRVTSRGRVVA